MSIFLEKYFPEILLRSTKRLKEYPDDPVVVCVQLALLNLKHHNASADIADGNISFVKFLEDAAKKGDSFSLYIMGLLKLEGLEPIVSQDQATGHAFIEVSAFQDFCLALITKGTLCAYKKDFSGAEESFLKARSIEPNNIKALRNLGVLYLQENRWREAFYYLKKAEDLGDGTFKQVKAMILNGNSRKLPLHLYKEHQSDALLCEIISKDLNPEQNNQSVGKVIGPAPTA